MLDVVLRFSAIALLLAIGGLALVALIAGGKKSRQKRLPRLQLKLLMGLCISLCGPMVLGAHQQFQLEHATLIAANAIAIPNIALVWIFGLSLFVDGFRLKTWHMLIFGGVTVLGLLNRVTILELSQLKPLFIGELAAISALLLYSHLLAVVGLGAADDLLAARRQARYYVVLALALGGLISVLSEVFLNETVKNSVQASIVLSFAIAMMLWLIKLEPARLAFETPIEIKPAVDDPVYRRLLKLLDEDRIYLQPGLSVADVAGKLHVPAHRLRDLLNRRGGHGNFSKFINGRRIEDAKSRLSDPNQQHLPILTIALDCGFNSIAPFNRAFREFVGETPSAFRARSQISQNV